MKHKKGNSFPLIRLKTPTTLDGSINYSEISLQDADNKTITVEVTIV